MSDIRVAFWNLENLFDTAGNDIATDFGFTPAEGWTDDVLDAKLNNLAEIVKQMHSGAGPDLLGICEVENRNVAERLIERIGRTDLTLAHINSPDLRGIDTSLIYSNKVFALAGPPSTAIVSHAAHLRYPTRDIFEVTLKVKDNNAEIKVLVNHWPSRRQGRFESEPFRMTLAELAGRIVDEYVRMPRDEFMALPDKMDSLRLLNERWNRNVLVMGDLNDEPFDRSVLDYLQATKDTDLLEEQIKAAPNAKKPAPLAYLGRDISKPGKPLARKYLGIKAYLFNCMWRLMDEPDTGTHYFAGGLSGTKPTHTMDMLDQFIVSRGLYYGASKLKIDLESVEIFKPKPLVTPKGRPRPFDRKTKKGYSDHLPIQCVIRIV
jgi:endonuclease/exonuclease/phosphatase family metal-dependent hydrolase